MADILANGLRIHCQRLGDETHAPVVFVHGLVMDNLASWYFTVANSVAAFRDVVLYDLRGHGRSERPPTGYTLADMVDDLDALLQATVGAKPVTLVGNSFGGLLALAFALRHPRRASGLVLVDAHLGSDGFGEQMARTLELKGEERDRQIAESFKHWLGRHSERKRTRLADSATELVGETTLIRDMRATAPLRAEDLTHLDLPTLALYGEHSDLLAKSAPLVRAIPGAKLHVLPGCTHSILWEATDEVRDRIVAFIRDLPGGAA
jgi:pimeloyl-ACP methyl ester carboxylesterase